MKSNSIADVLTAYKIAMATVEARVHCAPGGRWVWRSLSSRSLSLVGRRHTRLWAPRGQESAPSSVPHAQHLSSAGAAGWSRANPRAMRTWRTEGPGPEDKTKQSAPQVEKAFYIYGEFGLSVRKGSRYSQALNVSFQLLPGHKRSQEASRSCLSSRITFLESHTKPVSAR